MTAHGRRALALVVAPLATAALVALLLLETTDRDEPGSAAPAPHAAVRVDGDAAALRIEPLPGRSEAEIAPLALPTRPPAEPVLGEPLDVVAGQVVRAADGTPLPGAIVRALPLGEGPEATAEGPEAQFSLRSDAGLDVLEVRYLPPLRSWPHLPQSFPLDAAAPGTLRLEYDSGFTLTGTVADDEGRPLPGALVSVLVSGSGSWSSLYVTAGADGRYRLQDLSPPAVLGAISVVAQADGYCQATGSLPLAADAPLLRRLDLALTREAVIEVSARDASGETAPQLRAIVLTDTGRIFESSGRDEGKLRIGRLPAGRHTLVVAPLGPNGELAPTRVDGVLLEAGQTTRVEVLLTPGATVAGRVTDASGAPVPKADVWFELIEPQAEGRSADLSPASRHGRATGLRPLGTRSARFTDEDGLFELHGVPQGRVRIVAKGKNLARASTELVLVDGEARSRVDFELRPGVELAGRVLMPDGSPMQFCTKVLVLPVDRGSDEVLAVCETGPEGAFVADSIAPGPKRLLVVGADGSWVEAPAEPGGELQTFVASH